MCDNGKLGDYRFEEGDDPRTSIDSSKPLVMDMEKIEIDFDADEAPFDENADLITYYELFEAVLHACGKVAYYWKMLKGINHGSYPIDEVVQKYSHDVQYYIDKCNEWKNEAERALETLKKFNYNGGRLPYRDRDFLNALVSEDRRTSYRGTIKLGKKNKIFILLRILKTVIRNVCLIGKSNHPKKAAEMRPFLF